MFDGLERAFHLNAQMGTLEVIRFHQIFRSMTIKLRGIPFQGNNT